MSAKRKREDEFKHDIAFAIRLGDRGPPPPLPCDEVVDMMRGQADRAAKRRAQFDEEERRLKEAKADVEKQTSCSSTMLAVADALASCTRWKETYIVTLNNHPMPRELASAIDHALGGCVPVLVSVGVVKSNGVWSSGTCRSCAFMHGQPFSSCPNFDYFRPDFLSPSSDSLYDVKGLAGEWVFEALILTHRTDVPKQSCLSVGLKS